MEREHIAPHLLFRSFLIVAGSYLFSIFFMALLTGLVAMFFFPATFEFVKSGPTIEQFQNNPDLALPNNLFLIMLAGHSLFCVGLGWLVTRFSPYAKIGHAIFLAVVMFVGFLQEAVAYSGELQRMKLIMMCVFPIAVLIGAKLEGGQQTAPAKPQ